MGKEKNKPTKNKLSQETAIHGVEKQDQIGGRLLTQFFKDHS